MATKGNLLPSVQALLDNSNDVFTLASEILIKFANNILSDPNNEKYRKIRVGNAIVSEKLLPVSGAIECLFEMGFVEDGDFFTFPKETSLLTLGIVRDQLVQENEKKKSEPPKATTSTGTANAKPVQTRRALDNIMKNEAQFFKKLQSSAEHVKMYEDPMLQAKARELIPVERLQEEAKQKKDELTTDGDGPSLSDMFLIGLLGWFKKEFFKWVDSPPCDRCQGKTQSTGMAQPTQAELLYGAGRVENYICTVCSQNTRFPRYNHPGKLLETRRGRCGEWANCFTLCCRSMGYEARYVLDWTDHVWTEVYSDEQKRWMHCDPCENVCDKPLLYESGWGKKLTYVVAFAVDDIQDVTWRYSAKHDDVLQRRNDCREIWLVGVIVRMRKSLQSSLNESRKKIMQDRLVSEMVELITVKDDSNEQYSGRTTGSAAWRSARGEMGQNKKVVSAVIKPTASEVASKVIHLQYNCASDKYNRISDNGNKVAGWQALAFKAEDVQRKEETDWGMVYLARAEGTEKASITWKFDLNDSSLAVDTVDIKAESECFENGQITWMICSEENCAMIPKGSNNLSSRDLAGSKTLSVTAEMRRGKGDCAWQHTQLFRQKLDDYASVQFSVRITLKSAS